MTASSSKTTNNGNRQRPSNNNNNNTINKPSSSSAGNVRVVARIRPLSQREENDREIMTSLDERLVQVKTNDGQRFFELDAVFGGDSTQRQVYETSGAQEAVIQDLFAGFNCTVRCLAQFFHAIFCQC